jgi:hypothetical protein
MTLTLGLVAIPRDTAMQFIYNAAAFHGIRIANIVSEGVWEL